MSKTRAIFLCLALAAVVLPAYGATLIAEFALRGSLDDNLGGPALQSGGGQLTALGYVFAANQGLTLTNPALTPDSYSVELSFTFDQTSGYRKIIDFRNLADDGGFYELSGALNFYPVVNASLSDFADGGQVHVVLTRDGATGSVVGYVNGQQRFAFADPGGAAVFSTTGQKMTFFVDDFATGQREAAAGTLNYLRVYDGALTAGEVTAAFLAGPPASVPEPAAVVLLALGSALAFLLGRAFKFHWNLKRRPASW